MKKYWKNRTKWMAVILGAVLLTAVWLAGAFSVKAAETVPSFDVSRFILPEEAKMLVVVEGNEGSTCQVYAYEKTDGGWEQRLQTMGIMGRNGMNNNRRVGDKTTPIGLFQLNTPFGQSDPQEGFPADYIKVGKRHVWSDLTNRLVEDASVEGEHVGTKGYQGYYDYALDAGFNVNAIPDQGSALFLHCWKVGRVDTSGCVAIPKEQMAYIMKLYGMYGKGACYIAQAPRDTFELVYDSYGVNGGLSPQGDFSRPGVQSIAN